MIPLDPITIGVLWVRTAIALSLAPFVATAVVVDKALGVHCPLFSVSKQYRRWRR